jgi:hypothetical protein
MRQSMAFSNFWASPMADERHGAQKCEHWMQNCKALCS